MPELECVGGPLDGTMKHFYGDAFEYPDDPAPIEHPLDTDEQDPRRHGVYVQAHLPSPRSGVRRSVWLWRGPVDHPPAAA